MLTKQSPVDTIEHIPATPQPGPGMRVNDPMNNPGTDNFKLQFAYYFISHTDLIRTPNKLDSGAMSASSKRRAVSAAEKLELVEERTAYSGPQ